MQDHVLKVSSCELTFQNTACHRGQQMPLQLLAVSGVVERQQQRQDRLGKYTMSEDKPPDPTPLFPVRFLLH